MGVFSRIRRATISAVAALWAVIPAMLGCIQTARAAPLETYGRLPNLEDIWLQLHLVFECMWDYRFLYRDLDEILSRDRVLASRFGRITQQGTDTVVRLCRSMAAAGVMRASEREIAALASNVGLVATYWISYQKISANGGAATVSLDRAAYQVLSLIAPFLVGHHRALLDRLSQDYL